MTTAQRIYEVLGKQAFRNFYEGLFAAHIQDGLHNAEGPSKEEVIAKIEQLFGDKPTTLPGFISTVKLLVRADTEGEAADYLAETFRSLQNSPLTLDDGNPSLIDWGYASVGKESPANIFGMRDLRPIEIPADYEEGDLI